MRFQWHHSHVFPYLTGPDAEEIEAVVCAGDFIGARSWLDARLAKALEGGLRALASGGWPLLRAALHLDLADIQAERDRGAAIAEARAALAVLQHIDAPGVAEAAIELLRRLGEKDVLVPRPSGPLDVLSRREREVFDLLAQGLSNAEIARRLVVTRKTTEHHVHRILRKLDMHSRAEVAAYAATLARPELVAS